MRLSALWSPGVLGAVVGLAALGARYLVQITLKALRDGAAGGVPRVLAGLILVLWWTSIIFALYFVPLAAFGRNFFPDFFPYLLTFSLTLVFLGRKR